MDRRTDICDCRVAFATEKKGANLCQIFYILNSAYSYDLDFLFSCFCHLSLMNKNQRNCLKPMTRHFLALEKVFKVNFVLFIKIVFS